MFISLLFKILAHTITNFIVILSCIYIMTLFLFVIFSLSSLIIFSKFHPSPLFLLHPRPTNLDSGYERKHDFASQYDSHDLQLHSVSCLLYIHSSLWLTRIHCTHPRFLYRSPFGRPQADCISWLLWTVHLTWMFMYLGSAQLDAFVDPEVWDLYCAGWEFC